MSAASVTQFKPQQFHPLPATYRWQIDASVHNISTPSLCVLKLCAVRQLDTLISCCFAVTLETREIMQVCEWRAADSNGITAFGAEVEPRNQ